jgi:hypothetical protein
MDEHRERLMSVWTEFWDMHSGGGQKEKFAHAFIEAPEDEAVAVFYARFGHNPNRVTCTCCGEDYRISESATLEQATAYQRGCDYDESGQGYVERPSRASWAKPYVDVETFVQQDDVLVIRANEIADEERAASVPKEGYVWL